MGVCDRWQRLWLTVGVLAMAYAAVQLPDVRQWYAPWDKAFHAGVFAGVAWLLRWCLPWPLWARALLALAMGGAVEVHQMFLPGFSPSWGDWAADAVGIAVAALGEGFLTRRKLHSSGE